MISQTNQHYEDKATASTIDEVGGQIENLQFKLDEISMNIASQVETEKVHYDRKSKKRISFANSDTNTNLCVPFCMYSDSRNSKFADLDECLQDVLGSGGMCHPNIHDHIILQQR